MDRWYNKYKSNEIVLSDRKPDTSIIPEDAPAGAFARIQQRKWKLWLVVNDLYNPTSVKNIFVRSGVKNDWIEYIPSIQPINDFWRSDLGVNLPDGVNDFIEDVRRDGRIGIKTNPTSDLHVNGSYAEAITIITSTTTLNQTHNKIVLNNGATNITITLPNALTCIGRKYEFSRYAGSTGSVTIVGTGSQIQALAGTVGATTTLGVHGARGQGLNHSFTAINVGGVGVWVRL